ncbi:MAG: shikimate kinase [Leptolyngbyaceae cyanobacterium CSU_1_3]|nr:shikimate kinase [Leptolyngbyaceae cyanobacterium CSU_1_3]
MMGAGKTTIGHLLAAKLGYQFFDTDTLIEQVAGQSVTQIFAESGEAAFRQLETQVLAELSPYTRLAIATGGGIVLKRENWGYLRHGIVVWFDVSIEQLCDRLQNDQTRPILSRPGEEDLATRLKMLSEQRQPLYAQADIHIAVLPNDSPDAIAERTIATIAQSCEKKLAATKALDRFNREAPYHAQDQISD